MGTIFNGPLPPNVRQDFFRVGLVNGQARYAKCRFGLHFSCLEIEEGPINSKDLTTIGKVKIIIEQRRGPDAPSFQSSVAFFDGVVQRGKNPPLGGLGDPHAVTSDCL